MAIAVGLGELTQATLNRLRGAEFHMRIVQLQPAAPSSQRGVTSNSPLPCSSADIDASVSLWRTKHGTATTTTAAGATATGCMFPPITLPSVLIDYYKVLQSDGLHFAASVARGSCAGTNVEPAAYVCCCRLNPISQILPIPQIDHRSFDLLPSTSTSSQPSTRPLSPTPVTMSTAATSDTTIRCFLLANAQMEATAGGGGSGVDGPRGVACDVVLVYRSSGPTNNPEVWGRAPVDGGVWFYLCRSVEDYLRLGCRMHWVFGWQLCFAPMLGPPPGSIPWLRLLAPGPMLQALSCV